MSEIARIRIRNQTVLKLYPGFDYKQVQFPAYYDVELVDKSIKMHIKAINPPKKEDDQFIVIFKSCKDLKPMRE